MQNNTALIILAGGKSSRMGSPKGLLDYFDEYWILEQVRRFNKINNPVVYIGLGYDYNLYFKAIPWFKEALNTTYMKNGVGVQVILNKHPQLGAFSTLQAVLKKIDSITDVLILPIDVPLLNTEGLKNIIATKNVVVIPKTTRNGHPVKLSFPFWKQLLQLSPSSKEARLDFQIKKLKPVNITLAKVTDLSVNQNINTQEEWLAYKKSATE